MGGEKRREHPRFAVCAVVEVTTRRGELHGQTRNVSRGGLCLELAEPLVTGEDVAIAIALVFQDEQRSEQLGLPARIVWCTPIDGAHQVGAKFSRLSARQLAHLDMFLRFIEAAPRTASAP